MDLTKLYNPYDFSNPVSDRSLFVGRRKKLEDIQYYLEQAAKAPRPTNLAVMGPRASGKTSILNMIELEARDRGFCVARVDLNESDASSEINLFLKIFDSLINAACAVKRIDGQSDCFGGTTGRTFNTYLDMVSTFCIPEDKTWCPFIFPIQYAKAASSGTVNCRISEASFKSDLTEIRKEVGRPIAILFDECNTLSKSRVTLEMLRNIFMNTPGYMLTFTGTLDLFPIMDEVFSPIIRQFKKINIERFGDIEETENCIRKPIESLRGVAPDELFDFHDTTHIKEIHELTGGKPYEIQLICHFLFRRVQTGQVKKMKLDVAVLDDVLRELQIGQDISARPVISKIRRLDTNEFGALDLLTQCSGRVTFDQVWFVRYVFTNVDASSKQGLQQALQRFAEQGLLTVKNGIISFNGDDFDRIYSKYFAKQRDFLLFLFSDLPLEVYFEVHLRAAVNVRLHLVPLLVLLCYKKGVPQ